MGEQIKFYDTNILLDFLDEISSNGDKIYLSSITLKELEQIKTNRNKDEDVKYKARSITRWLKDNEDKYECIVTEKYHYDLLESFSLEVTNDNLIIASAYDLAKNNDLVFITGDLSCYNIAQNVFSLKCNSMEAKEDEYRGFKEVVMTDIELANWYENKVNHWNLIDNEYLLIYNIENKVIDHYRYSNNEFMPIRAKDIKSTYLGKFKPLDVHQLIAVDSLSNNQMTMIKGKAGSGKSLICLSYLLSELEKGNIDKIVVFVNSPKVRGSVPLGFYKGTRTEKLLDSQIGSFLSYKLGGKIGIEELIENELLELLPMSDIRGVDLSGGKYGVYITEAQNTSIDLMKLAIQRVGESSKLLIDGDYTTQVDDVCFEGSNNGMQRVSQVFRGQDLYGEIELQEIHRSKIAEIAELM
ncbi:MULTISPECIES: PhoH family protein [unclassified Clostridium]|uniref:PhoH family protein n=1 Tax=unclassified Clostridium TaxID=2614128 RepID=UPI0025BE8C0C|nr:MULTISPECIES: PhoH family protein [unclassified Clostridium]